MDAKGAAGSDNNENYCRNQAIPVITLAQKNAKHQHQAQDRKEDKESHAQCNRRRSR